MISYLLSLLSRSADTPLVILLILCIFGFIAVGKLLLKEKDNEIELERDLLDKVTIGLKYVNDTQQAILIYLKRDDTK